MDHASWNNVPTPAESHLLQNAMSSSSGDFGESSSSANLHDQNSGDGLQMEPRWPFQYSAAVVETRLEDCQREPANIHLHERVGNDHVGSQVNWEPLSMQSASSDRFPVNLNATSSENNDERVQCIGANTCPSLYKSSRIDAEIPSASISSVDLRTSSERSSYHVENNGSGSSPGNCGSSCKRKALEGTSSQPLPCGNTGFFPQAENTVVGTVPSHHNASSSLNISVRTVRSQIVNSPVVGSSEQANTVEEVGMGGILSDAFPPSSVAGSAENSSSDFGPRFIVGHQEPSQFNLPLVGNSIRRSSARSSHHSSRSIFSDSSNSSNHLHSSNHSNHPHSRPGPSLNINMPFTWNGTLNSRTNSSSSSLAHPRDRGAGLREEANFRSTTRNNLGHPMFVPANETRNLVQNPTSWSMATGSSSSSAGVASSRQASSSSNSRPSGRTRNPLRLSDFAPWALFPSPESEAGVSREHVSSYQSRHSSPEETEMPSLGNVHSHLQPYSRHALSREVPGVEVNSWRSLAADIDARQRLVSEIRHVLHAMRRGENLRAEDYMLFDPFINGTAALPDRHRDLRLDVDNMSYEELLALEERIGDVNTGLSDETILKSMKQRQYSSFTLEASSKIEPCCICQEEYITGEIIGTLNCGHDFHTNCVKQWLLQKNVCPICKMTALRT